jgi:5'-3' exonuclease
MGVKGLYTYLRSYRSDITVETIPKEPKLRIGFDAMSMLYKYKSYYEEIYPMLKELKQRGYQLLFVFDGKTPVEKEAEVKERRDNRQGATDQAASLKEQLKSQTLTMREREILEYSVARLEFQGWHMTREIRHAFQDALTSMEIPYIKAVQEADDVLVDLIGAKKLDVVVSSDMDFLLSGVERLWIPFRKIGDGFEEILLSEVLKGEGMEIGTFVDAGILCGVEPLRGRLSILSSTAFNWLRYYKSIEKLLTSTVKDAQLEILKEEELLRNTRSHFAPHPWESRIRPDHLEKHKSFLETL